LSRSTGAVHVRLTGPRDGAAPLSAARRAAGRPRRQRAGPAQRGRARPHPQAGAARRARRGAPAPASPPEAMSLSMRPSPASPARSARRRVGARRAGQRGSVRGRAPAGAPGPVRSASCTCQGGGPTSGCPNGDVWKGEPGLCWARRLGAGVGVAAGMPGPHAMAPAGLAPAAGAAERVHETWRAACAPQRRLNFKMARQEPWPALLQCRSTHG